MDIKKVGIAGAGFYVPEKVVTNAELAEKVDTSDEWIQSRTGIKERRIAAEDQAASDLGVIAAQRALEDANIKPEEIDLILVATSSPDMVFPATACIIQNEIGATNAGACDLSAVCSGFVFALTTGTQLIASGTVNKVLVIATEKFSSFIDWEDRSTCVLMGDGAGAVVLTNDTDQGEILACTLGTDGEGIEELMVPAGGSAKPTSHATVDQKEHYMKMNGQEIYRFASRIIGEAVSAGLAKAGLQEHNLDLLIPHQANIRIIQSAAKRFNLAMEKIQVNIDRYSNTSAASVPIALAEAKQNGLLKKGMHIALVAFGGGLTWGSTIIKW